VAVADASHQMIERADRRGMTLDDCADVSRAMSAVLDVVDPIVAAYTLEVSSPGIDRPLVRLADYDRFAGFEARIEVDRLIDGRRRFQGRLRGTDGERVRIALEGGDETALPFADIMRAKLVLTDDLIAATAGPGAVAAGIGVDEIDLDEAGADEATTGGTSTGLTATGDVAKR